MAYVESQAEWRTPITAVVKDDTATRIRLGALGEPVPAPYSGAAGLFVTIRQTGFASLDGQTFQLVSADDPDETGFPDLVIDADTSHEVGPPAADAFVEIRPIIGNFARFPRAASV